MFIFVVIDIMQIIVNMIEMVTNTVHIMNFNTHTIYSLVSMTYCYLQYLLSIAIASTNMPLVVRLVQLLLSCQQHCRLARLALQHQRASS